MENNGKLSVEKFQYYHFSTFLKNCVINKYKTFSTLKKLSILTTIFHFILLKPLERLEVWWIFGEWQFYKRAYRRNFAQPENSLKTSLDSGCDISFLCARFIFSVQDWYRTKILIPHTKNQSRPTTITSRSFVAHRQSISHTKNQYRTLKINLAHRKAVMWSVCANLPHL